MQQSILIIDDESDIRKLLSRVLEKQEFFPLEADSGEAGLRLAKSKLPNLIVLDIMLPGMSGIEVCQALKRDPKTCAIPILIITGNDKEGQEVITLELGADDYLTKPFETPLFMAHLRALLRRGPYMGRDPKTLEKDGIRLDMERKVVYIDSSEFPHLTPKEFDLLYTLVANQPTPLSRENIYQRVWGAPAAARSMLRTVDVHVQRIRSKLGLSRKEGLVAVSGRGYRWSRAGNTSPEGDSPTNK